MYIKTKALILRESIYKDTGKVLTLLTEEHGKVTASVHGVYSKKNSLAGGTQQLTYSELELDFRSGRYTVKEAFPLEYFCNLRNSFENFSLGCYFAECLEVLSHTDMPDRDMLSLGLNALYALSNNLYDPVKIKAAFELQIMKICGYRPELDYCKNCGELNPEMPVFCYENGCLVCSRCCKDTDGAAIMLDSSSLAAMRYILAANTKKFLSFSITVDSLSIMERACEVFFLNNLDRSFNTLDYWKSVK